MINDKKPLLVNCSGSSVSIIDVDVVYLYMYGLHVVLSLEIFDIYLISSLH